MKRQLLCCQVRNTSIALRAYLDSSGTLKSSHLTLAAFAGPESCWQEFDAQWAAILDSHTPRAPYIHMRELRGLRKAFDRRLGWTYDNAFALVTKCLMYLQTLDKKRFKMFYAWADLAAWKRLRGETYQIPEPVQLCNQYCAESILAWYVTHYPDVIDEAHYHFDRAERFKESFEKKWNDEKDRAHENGDLTPWSVITKIEEVDMRHTPGVQAADILAWAANREATGTQGPGQGLCHLMRQIIPSLYRPWDEASMRQYFKRLLHLPGR